ncbi:2-amino-4-hydroxy-6-hydroxymethyldihydropteridine pyrophosphokinase [Jannaschia pagri]|uniref:2-amino-4-hydroxy-6-hydroxymethyldihydropteridine pyrophosphokinase n=1 Tax=Jannaschia pagri TaxID=2829797 RepID=A0ABQ4NGY7_9RHOB|nr:MULTISPECIES: 2-amino-4-hydroxy-6-hydroxymethyldihydropteridine diphosphokinase [unclassified Jannaschia]GIT90208.1 2-amino-4-hydroxy-6-hydroxymethyldihydropteridine pyrophosphokinase [Jannaschia sp. AI_61]GIT93686.1 2-amino-4-hydroxy-6-hydroxymethyldihydropteridine pyrophosphokinase [Jannaschia sp. AI_62]
MSLHLIALGANSAGTRAGNARRLALAAGALRAVFGPSTRVSPLYATPAWPPGIGPDFVNAAAAIQSDLPSRSVLDRLHRIEDRFGRVRSLRWGARVLDLDLIATDGRVLPDAGTVRRWMGLDLGAQRSAAPSGLLVPHPRMQDRGFVLIPLAQIAPQWRHPLTGQSVRSMVRGLPRAARKGIRRLHPL